MATRLSGIIRTATVALAVFGAVAGGLSSGFAAEEVSIFDSTPDGMTVDVWASAKVDPLATAQTIGLEEVLLESCSAVAINRTFQIPTLIVAESYEVTVSTVFHGAVVSKTLAQGESTVMPARQGFRLSNGMSDRAYSATALLLYGVGDDDAAADRNMYDVGDRFVEWAEGSSCDDIRGNTQTTMFVLGRAPVGGDQLYVGTVLWEAGATTKGYEIVDPAASFNVQILSGGMGNAGFGTGRGIHAGPYRAELGPLQTLRDGASGFGGMSTPFENDGAAPVYAIFFGIGSAGKPVYVEV